MHKKSHANTRVRVLQQLQRNAGMQRQKWRKHPRLAIPERVAVVACDEV